MLYGKHSVLSPPVPLTCPCTAICAVGEQRNWLLFREAADQRSVSLSHSVFLTLIFLVCLPPVLSYSQPESESDSPAVVIPARGRDA